MTFKFNPSTGLEIPSTSSIRDRISKKLQQCFYRQGEPLLDTEPSTPAGQMVDLIVSEIQSVYASLAYYVSQLSPVTAEGRFQDAYASLYSIARKVAQPTIVVCECKGVAGTKIPYGSQVKTTSGETLILTAPVEISSSGSVSGFFRTAEYGAVPIPAHSATKIVTTVAGWESVDNLTAGVVGRNRETSAEFEARRLKSIAKNSHGSASSLEGSLSNLDGVIDCRVLENVTNAPITVFGQSVDAHSVAMCIFGGKDSDIAKAIFMKKDAGCGTTGTTTVKHKPTNGLEQIYKIIRPTPKAFGVKVSFKGGALSNEIQREVKTAILQDFLGNGASGETRVGLAQTVYALRFVSAINSVLASSSLLSVTIGWKEAPNFPSIDIKAVEEPTLTENDIVLTFEG